MKTTGVIQHISAVTLAVHDMARSASFYKKVGFELLYGGDRAVSAAGPLSWDLAPDGNRFLIITPNSTDTSSLTVALNWRPDIPKSTLPQSPETTNLSCLGGMPNCWLEAAVPPLSPEGFPLR